MYTHIHNFFFFCKERVKDVLTHRFVFVRMTLYLVMSLVAEKWQLQVRRHGGWEKGVGWRREMRILNIKWFHSFSEKEKRLQLKYACVLPVCQPLIKSKSRHSICLPQ